MANGSDCSAFGGSGFEGGQRLCPQKRLTEGLLIHICGGELKEKSGAGGGPLTRRDEASLAGLLLKIPLK